MPMESFNTECRSLPCDDNACARSAFTAFMKDTTQSEDGLGDIVDRFSRLMTHCPRLDGMSTYESIKLRLSRLCNFQQSALFRAIDSKINLSAYTSHPLKNLRILVAGAGPCGLRAAVEAALLGAQVTVVEKRMMFSRSNILHLWNHTIEDLKSLGVKAFYPKFCVGSNNHIGTRQLQSVLMRIALCLGVKVVHGSYICSRPSDCSTAWTADISPPLAEPLLFNVLIGADGPKSALATEFDFESRSCRAAQSIGITANFVNHHTRAEQNTQEITLVRYAKPAMFAQLHMLSGLDLENLVYFRGDTHYFVCTATKDSLLESGVLSEPKSTTSELLQSSNVDHGKLAQAMEAIASFCNLPSPELCQTSKGLNDASIFDFSERREAKQAVKFVGPSFNRLLVTLVGDALIEPFWPQGLGINRGLLSVQDAMWLLTQRESNVPEDTLRSRRALMLAQLTILNNPSALHPSAEGGLPLDPLKRYAHLRWPLDPATIPEDSKRGARHSVAEHFVSPPAKKHLATATVPTNGYNNSDAVPPTTTNNAFQVEEDVSETWFRRMSELPPRRRLARHSHPAR